MGGMGRSFLCVSAGTLLPYNHKKTPRGHRTRQGNTELAPNCPTSTNGYGSVTILYKPLQRDRPSGIRKYLYEPARGIQELAPDCHTITKPPSGIYKHLYRPAKGIESWHLTAIQLQAPLASANTLTSPPEEHRAGTSLPYTYEHGTPLPSYTPCEPTATNHSHLLYPLRSFTPPYRCPSYITRQT